MLVIKQPSNGLEEYDLNNLKLFHPLGEIALAFAAFTIIMPIFSDCQKQDSK